MGLCNQGKLLDELVLHDISPMDSLRGLFFEGVCEELLSLSLGLYYTYEVTNVGLSATDVLSLLLSGCAIVARCGDMAIGVWFYVFLRPREAATTQRKVEPPIGVQLVPIELQASDDVGTHV